MSDREQVEAYWNRVLLCDGSYREYPRGTVLINWDNHRFYDFPTFSAALAFTEEHKEKARQLREQIENQRNWIKINQNWLMEDGTQAEECKQSQMAAERTLAMLESALAQHMIGVKGVTR